MTGPTRCPQEPPSGLRLWLRVLGDLVYAAWVAVRPPRRQNRETGDPGNSDVT